MNYNQLLLAAQKNSDKQSLLLKRNGPNGRTRGPDPAAVAAFKARKEREERERILRAEQEKNRLLALRAMNSKSMKKAHMMKSRTKDNDFSKIITTDKDICVNEQISEHSFKDTKERMKARIDLEQKLSGLSRREKERYLSKWGREQSSIIKLPTKNYKQQNIANQNDGSIKINKPKSAPPISYEELLRIASEKSQVKISLEEEIRAEIEFNQAKVEKRISTITQKERQREEQRYKTKASSVNKQSLCSSVIRSPLTQSDSSIKEKSKPFSESKLTKNTDSKSLNSHHTTPAKASNKIIQTKQIKSSVLGPIKNNLNLNSNKLNRNEQISNMKKCSLNATKKLPNSSKSVISSDITEFQRSSQQNSCGKSKAVQSRLPSFSSDKPRPKLPPIGATYRRGIYDNYYYPNEQEDTYYEDEMDDYDDDDDMDDFIDDGPLEQDDEEEYSKHIREIFGYDKRKYRHMIEDDDDCEVATYGQVMREEMRSLREGIKEDLEDIQREEEEKRLKKKMKFSRLKR